MLLFCKKKNTTRKAISNVLLMLETPNINNFSLLGTDGILNPVKDIFRTVMKRYYIASFWSCLPVVSNAAWKCCRKETKVYEVGHCVRYIECVELFEFFERWIEYNLFYTLFLLLTRFRVSSIAWNSKHIIWNDGVEA